MYRLIRFLAVIALALSPVWGVQTVSAVNHAAYPVWPSFLSTGCNGIQGPGGSTTIACGQGAFLLSQLNSGYECTTVYISITQYQSGTFIVTGTANSGSLNNNVSIDATGDYYMQFQGYLVNNLITVQISAPGGGAMTIGTIGTGPCPVAPTATPVPATDTANPSDTATLIPDTATPGPSQTPTAIPTFTPLPSGHKTFTVTPVASASNTATITPVPGSGGPFNCGDASFPLLNCNMYGGAAFLPYGTVNTPWVSSGLESCVNDSGQNPSYNGDNNPTFAWIPSHVGWSNGGAGYACNQDVSVPNAGTIHVSVLVGGGGYVPPGTLYIMSQPFADGTDVSDVAVTAVGSGTQGFTISCSNCSYQLRRVWVVPPGSTDTPTPLPFNGTGTAVAALTLTAGAGSSTPTNIPIPGEQSTPIATSTECPGGCAVAALTAIPGLSTRVLVDTSPFSELTHLSLARNSCKAFGYVQIPEPVIHGTPALGSTTPLSITWTLPVTHDWDNTNPYSNTAIQPCAMNEIPTFVWDVTYWFSVFAIFTVWIMWLLGFVGRFSGDENING